MVAQMVKNLPVMQETWVQFLGQEDPLEKGLATNSRSLPREFNGKCSLLGYSPWGCKESDKTERITLTFHYLPPPPVCSVLLGRHA